MIALVLLVMALMVAAVYSERAMVVFVVMVAGVALWSNFTGFERAFGMPKNDRSKNDDLHNDLLPAALPLTL